MVTIIKTAPNVVTISNTIERAYYYRAFSISELSSVLDVTPQTIRRWCRGAPVPKVVQIALETLLGQIPGEGWEHYGIHHKDGKLYGPHTKRGFSASELDNWGMVYETVRLQKREIERLESELEKERRRAPPRRAERHGSRLEDGDLGDQLQDLPSTG